MAYDPPIAEQRFALETLSDIGKSGIDGALVDAVLAGAGALAAGVFAPLSRVGDRIGARWADGRVTMPEGYRAAWRAYADGGWGAIAAPVEAGGQGLPFALAMAVLEQLGSADMAFALCPMLTMGAIEAIHAHGSAAQKALWLPPLVSGEWTGAMALTEPQAGSDVGALRTMATPRDDGSFAIAGTKIFITYGEHDLTDNIVHLVLARTPGAPAGTRGLSMFIVPKRRADAARAFIVPNDVRCTGIEHKLGIHASPTCVMTYGDAGDCRGWLIGAEAGGMRAMFTMMNTARLNVGLQGVQIAERAMQAAAGYARERIQSGPIIAHPDVRRMLMRMRALTQGARALLYEAAGQVDRARGGDAAAGARADLLTPIAKSWASDAGCEAASLGLQVHGGMGYIEETGAAQYYRDARIAPIYEGTNGIQAADLVGRKLDLEGGQAAERLIADVRLDGADEPRLIALADAAAGAIAWMRGAPQRDRLAGSAALLDVMAAATAGALLARQARIAGQRLRAGEGDPAFMADKIATARSFIDTIAAEALGNAPAMTGGAAALYAIDAARLG